MSFFAYTRDIPDGPNNPSQDQPKMKINNNNIDDILEKDHYSFNDNLGGYHNIIHQPPTSDPAAIAGVNQIYVKTYTPDTTGGIADTQLFTRTGNGGISQLTGASTVTEGWVWCAGVLLQWGHVVTTSASNTVTFKDRAAGAIPFPNNLFNVQLTATKNNTVSTSDSLLLAVNTTVFDKTQFGWQMKTPSATITGFFWFAIGN